MPEADIGIVISNGVYIRTLLPLYAIHWKDDWNCMIFVSQSACDYIVPVQHHECTSKSLSISSNAMPQFDDSPAGLTVT